MTISIRYEIFDDKGTLIDWYNRTGDASLDIYGKTAKVIGGKGEDLVYVQAGTSADLTELSEGNDKIYLSGNLSDYKQEIAQDTGVYTLTRTNGLKNGQTEVIKFKGGLDQDVLYFADGNISLSKTNNNI